MARLIEHTHGRTWEEVIRKTFARVVGAYSCGIITPTQLIALRDPFGFRPLCIGFIPLPGQPAQFRLVFNQQQRLVAAADFLLDRLSGGGVGWFGSRRQENLKRASLVHFARHLNPSAVQFGDAVNGGQSQAGAFADFLGCEKRFKNPAQHLRVHAHAGIGNRKANEPAHARFGILLGMGRGDLRCRAADEKFADFGHRIARVHGQVHDGLLEHSRVAVNRGEVGGKIKSQRNVFAERAFEHPGHVVDDVV